MYYITEEIIIVINKWDEYEKETGTLEKYKKEVYAKLSYLAYAPMIFISAKTGQRVDKIFEMINKIRKCGGIKRVLNKKPDRYKLLYKTNILSNNAT